MFAANLSLQFNNLWKYENTEWAFVRFIFFLFWRNMNFQTNIYCKYHITYWAFVRFILLMFWRNINFQTNIYFKYHVTDWAFLRFVFHVLKKYDLSNYSLLQISHHRFGICKNCFFMFWRKMQPFKLCFLQICHFKFMFYANMKSQNGHL